MDAESGAERISIGLIRKANAAPRFQAVGEAAHLE